MPDEELNPDSQVKVDPYLPWGHPNELLLCEAARKGDLNRIIDHIGNGVNVNFVDGFGRTPLHYACQLGSLEAVKLLVANKARVNIWDADGTTPLHLAAKGSYASIVKFLAFNQADVKAECLSGCQPIDFAPYGSETWKVLLDALNGKLPTVDQLIQTRSVPLVPPFAVKREVERQAAEAAKKGKKSKKGEKGGKKKKKKRS